MIHPDSVRQWEAQDEAFRATIANLRATLARKEALLEAAEKVVAYIEMFTRADQPLNTVYPGDLANLRGLVAAFRAHPGGGSEGGE